MNGPPANQMRVLQTLGCLSFALLFFFLCLFPIFFVDLLTTAMQRLHLTPSAAMLAVLGIILGSMINVPIYRIERGEEQIVATYGVLGSWHPLPQRRWVRRDTLIAINVGGGVVPVALAFWEATHVFRVDGQAATAMLWATVVNIGVCYLVARPVSGIGIMMPGFTSPLVAVSMTWILLGDASFSDIRAPVAFVAGVLGPLVGADLLHLKDITRVSVGSLSIGGAGTFDGIVLSGIFAAILA